MDSTISPADMLANEDWLAEMNSQSDNATATRADSEKERTASGKKMADLPSPFSPLPSVDLDQWQETSVLSMFGGVAEPELEASFPDRTFVNTPDLTVARPPRLGLPRRPGPETEPAQRSKAMSNIQSVCENSNPRPPISEEHPLMPEFDWLSSDEDGHLFTPRSGEIRGSSTMDVGRDSQDRGEFMQDKSFQSRRSTLPRLDMRIVSAKVRLRFELRLMSLVPQNRAVHECRCRNVRGVQKNRHVSDKNPFEQKVTELLDLLSSVYKAGVSMSFLDSDEALLDSIDWMRDRIDSASPNNAGSDVSVYLGATPSSSDFGNSHGIV